MLIVDNKVNDFRINANWYRNKKWVYLVCGLEDKVPECDNICYEIFVSKSLNDFLSVYVCVCASLRMWSHNIRAYNCDCVKKEQNSWNISSPDGCMIWSGIGILMLKQTGDDWNII